MRRSAADMVHPLGLFLQQRTCCVPTAKAWRSTTMTTTKFGLAQPIRRVEDPRLLKGAGRYTDDIVLPNMLFGVVLRSPHAAARITRLDTAAAANLPGIAGIY